MPAKMLHHRSSVSNVLEDYGIVSSKFVTITNRLFTAAMLVAMLIACQEMPENEHFGDIQLEQLAN